MIIFIIMINHYMNKNAYGNPYTIKFFMGLTCRTSLHPPCFTKCLYQARKVRGHVFVSYRYRCCLFLPRLRLGLYIVSRV